MGSVPIDSNNYLPGSTVTVSGNTGNLLNSGYFLSGWNTKTDGTGINYPIGASFTIGAANITLYAVWTPITYTVTYNSGGGSSVSPQNVTFPATTVGTLPAVPTYLCYYFNGWYTAPNGGGTQFTASTTVSANTTIYAYWIPSGSVWAAAITPLPSSAHWISVTYGNGVFVAISLSTAEFSTDGKNWTAAITPLPSVGGWSSVTYGNGVFVAIDKGSTAAAYSTDGMNWTAAITPLPSSASWYSVTYGNGVFAAVDIASTAAAYSH